MQARHTFAQACTLVILFYMELVFSLQLSVPTHVTCLCLCAQLWGGTLGAGHKGGAIPVLQPRTSALPARLRHSRTCLMGEQ